MSTATRDIEVTRIEVFENCFADVEIDDESPDLAFVTFSDKDGDPYAALSLEVAGLLKLTAATLRMAKAAGLEIR